MNAFNGQIHLKKEVLQKIIDTKKTIKQGHKTYWNWKTGTILGNIIQHENKSIEIFSEKYGFSKDLLEIQEYIFNNIDEKQSIEWSFNFFKRIEVGENTAMKFKNVKKKLLIDEDYGLLKEIANKSKCPITSNIICFISEKLNDNSSFDIEDLIESTLNPLINKNIDQCDYQDIIDTIDIILNHNNNIDWVLKKVKISNLIKIVTEEILIKI